MTIKPKWLESIRSLVTLILTIGFVVLIHRFVNIVFQPNYSKETLVVVSSIILLLIV